MPPLPRTLSELKSSAWAEPRTALRTVRDEIRENLLRMLESRQPLLPGLHGYNDSVIPQVVNALLSRHHFILLGLRGQAKSRLLRQLTSFLDERIPAVAGCEISDNPFRPICRSCRDLLAVEGDATPIGWIPREARFVEKLATPDVTIADILGDVDPIRAARSGRDLSDELTIHYGLLPRANRGIFAINELPDLAGKIQVGLFNVMQEGDVQIKGYPLRLPLDLLLVFTANPEDYTARGKIVTPLKDRIGSEIRTHYPATVEEAMGITRQEAWLARRDPDTPAAEIPGFVAELIEEIAFLAREDKRVDRRSGVSQRLPITCIENVASSAEQRVARNREARAVARISDVYAAIPALTGKIELEYEGELRGADAVARELIRAAIGRVFSRYFGEVNLQPVVQWFEMGGELKLDPSSPAADVCAELQKIQGLFDHLGRVGVTALSDPALTAAAAELILEGLWAHKRVQRSEERGFYADRRKAPEPASAAPEPSGPLPRPPRRQFN